MNIKKRLTAKILSLALIFFLSVPSQNKVYAEGIIDTAIVWAPTAAAVAAFSVVSGSVYYFFPKSKEFSKQEIRILGMRFSHELIRVTTALLAGGVAGFAAHQGVGFVLVDSINNIEKDRAKSLMIKLLDDGEAKGVVSNDHKLFFDVVTNNGMVKKNVEVGSIEDLYAVDISKIKNKLRDAGIDTEEKIEQFYRGMYDGFNGALDILKQRKARLEFSNRYGWGLFGGNVDAKTLDSEIANLEKWVNAASVTYSGIGLQSGSFFENQFKSFLSGTGQLVTAGFVMKRLEERLVLKSSHTTMLNQMGDQLDKISMIVNMGIADKELVKEALSNIIQQCDGLIPYSAPERQRADFLMREAEEYLKRLEEEDSADISSGKGDPIARFPQSTSRG